MTYYLLGGAIGILAFCLIYGGTGWLLIEIDHWRKCRQIRREWERQCGASRPEGSEIPQVPTVLVPGAEAVVPPGVCCGAESAHWVEIPLWLTRNGRDSLQAQFGQLFLPAITRVVEAINAWIH